MSDRRRAFELFDLPFVNTHVNKVMSHLAGVPQLFLTEMQGRTYGMRASLIESPIELVFWLWWEAYAVATFRHTMLPIHLIPQEDVTVGGRNYRLDFWVTDRYPAMAMKEGPDRLPLIAVELDGHEFHERTKEQVTLRNERDRDLQAAGWTVLHFSGSEVAREPLASVKHLYGFCFKRMDWFR